MWFLMAAVLMSDPLPAPSPSPACLTGRLAGKDAEIDEATGRGRLILDIRMTNECPGILRAYRGEVVIESVGPDGGRWTADLSALRPALDPKESATARFFVPLGSSVAALWIFAVEEKDQLRLTWTTQVAAFTDGRLYVLPGVEGEADDGDASSRAMERLRKTGEVIEAINGGP